MTESNTKSSPGDTVKGLIVLVGVVVAVYFGCVRESPEERAAAEQQAAAERIEQKRKGFHCLSTWDGSHSGVVRQVKAVMNDPDSFDHVETLVSPNNNGQHVFTMKFRGRNAFGGVVTNAAKGTYSNSTCTATVNEII